jgi:ariadne-1
MQPWSEHGQKTGGYYNCNKYEDLKKKGGDSDIVKKETERESFKDQLRKYMFYFERYNNHERSEKHARELRQPI